MCEIQLLKNTSGEVSVMAVDNIQLISISFSKKKTYKRRNMKSIWIVIKNKVSVVNNQQKISYVQKCKHKLSTILFT